MTLTGEPPALHRRIDTKKGLYLINIYMYTQLKYTNCAYKNIHHCMNLYIVILYLCRFFTDLPVSYLPRKTDNVNNYQ